MKNDSIVDQFKMQERMDAVTNSLYHEHMNSEDLSCPKKNMKKKEEEVKKKDRS